MMRLLLSNSELGADDWLNASWFWCHRLVLALLSFTSHKNPPTYLLLLRWSLYTFTIMYNTVQLLLDIFIFCVFKKSFANCFFFVLFCFSFRNALAGHRGSYQTRKLTHYLLPLLLLALCFPLCYCKVMALRSQHPQRRHTAQIGGLVIQKLLKGRAAAEAETHLECSLTSNLVQSKNHIIWTKLFSLIHDLSGEVSTLGALGLAETRSCSPEI